MPWFFFHIRGNPHDLSGDELGFDFPDVETAYLEAFYAARDLRNEFATWSQILRDYTIEVTNAADDLVFALSFSAVFDHEVAQGSSPRFLQ